MASQKKVIVRQLDGTLAWGYLPPSGFVDDGHVQLLDISGKVQAIALDRVRSICFVRDFNLNDSSDPERLGRLQFAGKPRGEGLWLRVQLAGDTIEGLAQFDATFLDHLIEDRCVRLTPPDPKSNGYLMLLPRSALSDVQVIASIGSARKARPASERSAQPNLFGEA